MAQAEEQMEVIDFDIDDIHYELVEDEIPEIKAKQSVGKLMCPQLIAMSTAPQSAHSEEAIGRPQFDEGEKMWEAKAKTRGKVPL
eukprot:7147336-Karenia_brevis.AAC.1